jgi:hypothetical protein
MLTRVALPSSVNEVFLKLFAHNAAVAVLALIALEGSGQLGEARAAFQISLTPVQVFGDCTIGPREYGSGSTPDLPSTPLETLIAGLGIPTDGQSTGTSASPTSPTASAAMMAAISETATLPIPFVTLVRQARQRVAAISRPSPVFEPPRALS